MNGNDNAESHMQTPTRVLKPPGEGSHAERVSFRAAIFCIGVLSLTGWTVILALIYALV